MKRYVPLIFILIVLLTSLPTSQLGLVLETTNKATQFEGASMQNDTLRPTIEEWDLSASAYQGDDFDVWAMVLDESGVRNVSLIIERPPYADSLVPMTDNGTYYVTFMTGLPVNITYRLLIQAFDMVNNSATSYARTVDLSFRPANIFDSSLTMPYVVGSSFAVMAVVIGIAYRVYQRKKTDIPSS